MKIRENVGPRERVARASVGIAALMAAGSRRVGAWRWPLLLLGLANVVTAAMRSCPVNTLLGIDNTRGREWIHFSRSRRLGRRLDRWQRHIGATA